MKKELIKVRTKETAVKLQTSKIASVRIKDIERKAVRVYKDGNIGISGAIGDISDEVLEKQAIDNLQSNIPYKFELSGPLKDHRNYVDVHMSEEETVKLTERIVDDLTKQYDDFLISEGVKLRHANYQMKNSNGLDLEYIDEYLNISFIVKSKESSNLFDTGLLFQGRNLDYERFLKFNKAILEAERRLVELPKEDKLPVFFVENGSLGGFLMQHLNGEIYGNGASFFDKKIGEKIFHEKFTLEQNKNPLYSYSPFYDTEGIVNQNDCINLIENGVLKRVFTDKKIAEEFSLEHTGSAGGGYDDIPRLGGVSMRVPADTKDIKQTLNGKVGILVVVASGGEFNADGQFATPVQASYLFDGENLLGKLPNFYMNNDIYKMLGEDYIGTFEAKHLYYEEHGTTTACYMNIKKEG